MSENFLYRIGEEKFAAVARAKALEPLADVKARAADRAAPLEFRGALAGHAGPRLICEMKRASPSRGAIRADADVAGRVARYEAGGAAAVSGLTDGPYFGGSLADLEAARAACGIPILRKDFLVDPYQVYEARAAGADAVLLIMAMLDWGLLMKLRDTAKELGMAVLCEVHDEEDLQSALILDADIIGINNRDLKTLKVSLDASRRLLPLVPAAAVAVSESGIRTPAQVRELWKLGARAFLVGEALMEQGEDRLGEAIAALVGAVGEPEG